ncbi:HLH, helix-loop-helix DNA-binding protein [Glarea lozoyensis ATCC 20868]|uniref:HLH, helix-loop-helix DNA-binding protein n=1 Tax=Glarea lozoyensis (strain ATCC 20868 / MF5171) TaxID=1116229 RepID=S3D2J5_GLAL2|nr:HLH, helix-loop-helix DNA-binding protein [Glarea lozoyensis ATCC 20868]EPE32737.1 HLH, helix-loop-helix DNA-binding protein [Glarea lozoyensis ATCC 20868]
MLGYLAKFGETGSTTRRLWASQTTLRWLFSEMLEQDREEAAAIDGVQIRRYNPFYPHLTSTETIQDRQNHEVARSSRHNDPQWVLEDDQFFDCVMAPLSSPSRTPVNLLPNSTNPFNELFGSAVSPEESPRLLSSLKDESLHSLNGYWMYNQTNPTTYSTAFWKGVLPTDLDGAPSELHGLFSDQDLIDETFSLEEETLPNWPQCSSAQGQPREDTLAAPGTTAASTSRDVSTHSGLEQTSISMRGLPALRTTTPIQASHRPVTQNDVVSETIPGSRTAHNIVEKHYRNRLNLRFSSLLQSIPQAVLGSTINSARRSDGTERKVSKSEVLALAKRAIEFLQKKLEVIEQENKSLRGATNTTEGVRNSISNAD